MVALIFSKWVNGKKTRHLGSWIGLIATRKTIDYLRSADIFERKPDSKVPTDMKISTEDSEDEVSALDYFGIVYDVDTSEKNHARILFLRLTMLVKNIPLEEQRNILYYTFKQMDIGEIAQKLNIDKDEAIQAKSKALKKLRKYYFVSHLGITWTDEDDFNRKLHALQQQLRKFPDETDREILKQTLQAKQPDTIAKSLNMNYHELIHRQNEALEKFKLFLQHPDNTI